MVYWHTPHSDEHGQREALRAYVKIFGFDTTSNVYATILKIHQSLTLDSSSAAKLESVSEARAR